MQENGIGQYKDRKNQEFFELQNQIYLWYISENYLIRFQKFQKIRKIYIHYEFATCLRRRRLWSAVAVREKIKKLRKMEVFMGKNPQEQV